MKQICEPIEKNRQKQQRQQQQQKPTMNRNFTTAGYMKRQ